jgi:hypothetical protein
VVLPEKPIQLSMPPLPPHQTATTTMTLTTTTQPQMRLITHDTETKPGEESPPVSEPTLAELIGQNFKMEDWAWALKVAFCESSAQPEDTNSKALHRRSGASGWFQHLPKFWEERTEAAGIPGADIMDPETNVVIAAYLLYETPQGTGHWYPSEACWG